MAADLTGKWFDFSKSHVGPPRKWKYHVLLARDLHFMREQEYRNLSRQTDELQRMLTALMRKIQPAKA